MSCNDTGDLDTGYMREMLNLLGLSVLTTEGAGDFSSSGDELIVIFGVCTRMVSALSLEFSMRWSTLKSPLIIELFF